MAFVDVEYREVKPVFQVIVEAGRKAQAGSLSGAV